MDVLPSRVADHGVAFGLAFGGVEAAAWDDDVGCVGAAYMFERGLVSFSLMR